MIHRAEGIQIFDTFIPWISSKIYDIGIKYGPFVAQTPRQARIFLIVFQHSWNFLLPYQPICVKNVSKKFFFNNYKEFSIKNGISKVSGHEGYMVVISLRGVFFERRSGLKFSYLISFVFFFEKRFCEKSSFSQKKSSCNFIFFEKRVVCGHFLCGVFLDKRN